jgi:A/G-specific adenine glycosylase
MPSFFAKHLLHWQTNNPRPLPWDGGPRNPYHIWISEIIMQQTRIEQGAPYYLRFIDRFPSVRALASVPVDDVLHSWQGLGYYTRARNIHKAAQRIVAEYNGAFPDTYDGLLSLPGIGPYSAAAIASFAYGLPYPVVDGNVKRVIARFCGITESIDDIVVHENIKSISGDFMKGVPPDEFNQAIMNFGAIICKPGAALCNACPLSKKCFAFQHDMVELLPVRSKKKTNTVRHFHFLVISFNGKLLLQRREEKDIWRGLYTPLIIESNSTRKPSLATIHSHVSKVIGDTSFEMTNSSSQVRQLLSHQTIIGRFHSVKLTTKPNKILDPYVWVTQKTINDFGKPKMVVEMIEQS